MIEFFFVFALAIALAWPLGRYLAAVMRGAPMRGDRLFAWIERPLYRLLGVEPTQAMGGKTYATAFLLSNLLLALLVFAIFITQAWLPLNPNQAPNMRWDLALHTMVSFLTNTNQQHYSGQAQLSFFAHMTAIVGLQVIAPMMGLAIVVATLRGLLGGRTPARQLADGSSTHLDLGNYWADVIRPTVRFMLPLCLLWSLLLTSQGVPATLQGGPVATPIDFSAGMTATYTSTWAGAKSGCTASC